jgi:hypothetical protein
MGQDAAKDLLKRIGRTGKRPKRLTPSTERYISEMEARRANRQVEGLKGKKRKKALEELLA